MVPAVSCVYYCWWALFHWWRWLLFLRFHIVTILDIMVLTEFSRYSYIFRKYSFVYVSHCLFAQNITTSHISSSSSKASGAYVFRPNGTFPIEPEGEVRSLMFSYHTSPNSCWIITSFQSFISSKYKNLCKFENYVSPISRLVWMLYEVHYWMKCISSLTHGYIRCFIFLPHIFFFSYPQLASG